MKSTKKTLGVTHREDLRHPAAVAAKYLVPYITFVEREEAKVRLARRVRRLQRKRGL